MKKMIGLGLAAAALGSLALGSTASADTGTRCVKLDGHAHVTWRTELGSYRQDYNVLRCTRDGGADWHFRLNPTTGHLVHTTP